MSKPIRNALWAGVSLVTLLAGAAANAAPADTDATKAGEVVVTAQKRQERLLDVPLPVQSLSAEQLKQANITKVSDLVEAIPGASIVSATTPGFETIEIRGIASGTTGDGLVGYYVGDTPFGVPNLQLTPPARLLDLERVEVVRGPSGTLYGQGSMGGTIKLILAQPNSHAFSGKAQIEDSGTSGGGNNYNGDIVLNLPLVDGKLAARVSAGYEYLSGYADAPELNQKRVNDFRGQNIRGTLGWTPTNDLTLTASVWDIRNKQNFSNSLTPHNAYSAIPLYFPVPYGFPAIAGTGGRHGYTDVNADIYSLTANWHTPIGDLVANTSYIDHTLDFFTPLLSILVNDSTFHTTSYTNEVRLTSLAGSKVKWLIGASNRDATIHSDIFYYSQIGLGGAKNSIINVIGPLTTKSWTVFGEVSTELFDGKLEPLVGLAYFEDKRTSDGLDRATMLPRHSAAQWDSLNPRFNLKFKPADNGNIYFNAAKGFRSGSLQTQAQADAANTTLGLPPGTIGTSNQPDSLWTYEVGTRWELADRTVLLEGSVYHTDWQKVLVQFATSAVITITNAGNATIDGADLGLAWKPVKGLTLRGSAAYDEAKFTSVVGALSVGTAIRVGGPVPNVPKTTLAVSADYKRPLDWFGGVTGDVYAGYAFRDRTYDATTKNLASGQLQDVTLRASLAKNRWTVEGFVTNALDNRQATSLSSTALQIMYPRRIGVRLGVDF